MNRTRTVMGWFAVTLYGVSSLWAGTLLREVWTQPLGIDQAVALATSGTPADQVEVIETAGWVNLLEVGYVARLSGWLTVPADGVYRFHVTSQDSSQVFVSLNEDVSQAVLVASVDGYTGPAEWDKYPDTQHSAPLLLSKGQVLALYAVMQAGGGGDGLMIGWTGPGLSQDIRQPTLIIDWASHRMPDLRRARNPRPAPGEQDVALDVGRLQWTPGRFAATHRVFAGTSPDDVNTATLADPGDLLLATEVDANTVALPPLELGQHIVWRVDEVNAAPDRSVVRGDLWSFDSEPVALPVPAVVATASSALDGDSGPEKAVDGSGLDDHDGHSTAAADMWISAPLPETQWIEFAFDRPYWVTEMVVWNSNQEYELAFGLGVKEARIEVSADGIAWETLYDSVTLAQAGGLAGQPPQTRLDIGRWPVRKVRLTILSNWGGVVPGGSLSEVRFLRIPLAARRPEPAMGQTLARTDGQLRWRAGRYAVAHEVYLDTERARVEALDPTVRVAVSSDRFLPLSQVPWAYGQTVFWRVVEDNGDSEPNRVVGPVWDFNTPPVRIVDDMESYTDQEPERIFDHWIDGWNDPDNGSTVGYTTAPFAEQQDVYGGWQAMPLSYDNVGTRESTATLTLGGQDWTGRGLQALTLAVLGRADNSGGQLFLEIDGHRVVYPGVLTETTWQRWQIPLDQVGADLTAVGSLAVGVTGAGKGLIVIDEIVLVP